MLVQFYLPKEFRFEKPSSEPFPKQTLEEALEILGRIVLTAGGDGRDVDVKQLVRLANELWRVRRTMIPPGAKLLDAMPLEQSKRSHKILLNVWDALEETGIKIVDQTGEEYRSGMMVKPTFQVDATFRVETVSLTLKPTIYFREKVEQTGEVEVSTPGTSRGIEPTGQAMGD